MDDALLAHLDTIARSQREKDLDPEEIVRRVAYQINLQRFKTDWPELPAPTFLLGISGQWGRGKTSIIIMLMRMWAIYDLFNNVVLLSGSGNLDPKMDFIAHTNDDMSYTPENLNKILTEIGTKKGSGTHLARIQNLLEGKNKSSKAVKAKTPAGQNSNSIDNAGVGARKGQGRKRAAPNPRKMLRGKEEVDPEALRSIVRRALHNGTRNLKEINVDQLNSMTDKEKAQFFRKMVTDKDLIFFDDSSGQNVLQRGSPLYQVITMLRHLGISAGFAYHSWKQLGLAMRKQVSTNIVFPCPPEEREAIGEGTELGPTAVGLLLQAMGRLPHTYLVINDRPEEPQFRYLLNFRVPLTPQMIAEVASREQAVVRGQRGSRLLASEEVALAPDSEDTGGTPLLREWLARHPQLDERSRPRTLPTSIVPSGLTPREKRALPEAQNLVLQVEAFTFPLVPDPAKLAGQAGLRSLQPRNNSQSMSTTALSRLTSTSNNARSQSAGAAASLPPSAILASAANANTPATRIANILLARSRRAATGAAVAGSLRAQQAVATATGDVGGAVTAAARLAAASRSPAVARQIAKTTARPDLSRIIRNAVRRPLGAGTNVLGRFTGRARLGPTGTSGAFRSRANARFANSGGGRRGGGGFAVPGSISQNLLSQLSDTSNKLKTLQAASEAQTRTTQVLQEKLVAAQQEAAEREERLRAQAARTSMTPADPAADVRMEDAKGSGDDTDMADAPETAFRAPPRRGRARGVRDPEGVGNDLPGSLPNAQGRVKRKTTTAKQQQAYVPVQGPSTGANRMPTSTVTTGTAPLQPSSQSPVAGLTLEQVQGMVTDLRQQGETNMSTILKHIRAATEESANWQEARFNALTTQVQDTSSSLGNRLDESTQLLASGTARGMEILDERAQQRAENAERAAQGRAEQMTAQQEQAGARTQEQISNTQQALITQMGEQGDRTREVARAAAEASAATSARTTQEAAENLRMFMEGRFQSAADAQSGLQNSLRAIKGGQERGQQLLLEMGEGQGNIRGLITQVGEEQAAGRAEMQGTLGQVVQAQDETRALVRSSDANRIEDAQRISQALVGGFNTQTANFRVLGSNQGAIRDAMLQLTAPPPLEQVEAAVGGERAAVDDLGPPPPGSVLQRPAKRSRPTVEEPPSPTPIDEETSLVPFDSTVD